MKMNKSNAGTYEQPPLGPQAAVLTRVIDIGTHTDTSPQYGTTTRRQLVITWELAEKMEDGRPFTIQKFYTASLNEKARLHQDLLAWFGKPPPEDMDTGRLLGVKCMLNIGESATGKAKVNGISRLPKGMAGPEPEGALLEFDLDAPDWSVFEGLTEWMQNKIRDSAEWQAQNGEPASVAPGTPPAPEGIDDIDPDDQIPW